MSVKIKIPAVLQSLTQGEKFINTRPGNISDICKDIGENYPLLAQKILDRGFNLKPGILIFLDEKDNKYFLKKNEAVIDGQKLVIMPSIAGG
jgi:molybdopterin converting factor small subunit